MSDEYLVVAERLILEFGDLPAGSVARVLTECAQEAGDADVGDLEQSVRVRLRAERRRLPAQRQSPDERDPRQRDQDRQQELDLTARLILMASDASGRLSQDRLDRALDSDDEESLGAD